MIEYSVAFRPMPGQVECGDGHLVYQHPGGALVAAVDGLGHGPQAAVAAGEATKTLEADARDGLGLTGMVRRCHERLLSTRGAVLSIASLDFVKGSLTWLGVGNVAGLLVQPAPGQECEHTYLISRNGVVGQNLPALREVSVPIRPGDTLIFATDGIGAAFPQRIKPAAPTCRLAEDILCAHAIASDDALVLVVRYLGGPGEP